jgi:ubiquinone biosynthesis protein
MQKLTDAAKVASFIAQSRVRYAVCKPPQFGRWLRRELAQNGPTFIKVGQALSSRDDVLPRVVTDELRSLQDNVNPMSFDDVKRVVCEETRSASLEEVFASFDETPIAAASIGQVHRAVLLGGRDVAVKVRKLGIVESFDRDVDALRLLLSLGGGEDATIVLDDLSDQLRRECDFVQEAENMRRFKKGSGHFHWLVLPTPVDALCTTRMLTMDFVGHDFKTSAVPTDFARKRVTAHRMVDLLMWMVTDQGLVHCDPHPGNMCLRGDGKIVLYDFGAVLPVTSERRAVMKELASHMYRNDAESTVSAMLSSGLIRMKSGRSKDEAVRFFSFIIGSTRPDSNISELRSNIGEPPPFLADPSMLRLFRTMVLMEGACKGLDPDFSYFAYMRPVLGALGMSI